MIVSKSIISFCCLLMLTVSHAQNKSTGYEKLDKFYNENGYSIGESDSFSLNDEPYSINLSLYGGSMYNIQLYALDGDLSEIESKLININSELCAKGKDGQIEVDLRASFGHYPFELIVSAPISEKGRSLFYVLSYKAFNNTTTDHLKNQTIKGHYTLDAVDKIEQYKNQVIKEIETNLLKILEEQGFSFSQTKVFDLKKAGGDLSCSLQGGNDYVILATSAKGGFENYKLFEPEKTSPFDRDKVMVEERLLMKSEQGIASFSLDKQSQNASELLIRVDEKEITNSYGGILSVFVIGNKRKD